MKQRHFPVSLDMRGYVLHFTSHHDVWITAENGLSFIETSALDASNVESAFQTILTGQLYPFVVIKFYIDMTCIDIYRIVSSKSLESSTSNIEPPKASINVGPTVDSNANQGGKCC